MKYILSNQIKLQMNENISILIQQLQLLKQLN